MKIYLVRHTAVDVPKGVCYGQTDVPLKKTFEKEAEFVKQQLDKTSFDASYSSPISRCTRLADYCGYGDAQLYDRLKEVHFGDWEMQRWSSIRFPEWSPEWINNAPDNGESFMQMYNRVISFFDELKEKGHESAVIFTHGGVIACAWVHFDGVDIHQPFKRKAKYGEIVEFTL